jgi:hypothetical protein
MKISWSELGLLRGVKARDVWGHREIPTADGYEPTVAPHSAILLKVHGKPSWQRASILEAETPSNARLGNAVLFPCGECSRGYAMQLGGQGAAGGVRFEHIHADNAGAYQLQILYVRNGLEDKVLSVSVDGEQPTPVRAIMRSWNVVTVPVTLRRGENNITITYAGTLPFDLDRIALSREARAPGEEAQR